MFVPFDEEAAAHYLCAILMSAPAQLLVASYTITTGISTHVLEHVRVPLLDSADESHQRLSDLSQQCHAAAKFDPDALSALEAEIDNLAAQLWGITDDELRAIQEALAEM